MKTLEVGQHKLVYYESVDELPMSRYQKFSKYLLVDAGLGADAEHFTEHVDRACAFIRSNQLDNAQKELTNMTQGIQLILAELSPAFLAFAALLYSVDGEEITDVSDEGLTRITEKLSDIPAGVMFTKLDEIKKKLETELATYFPGLFATSETMEYYRLLKQKALIIADQLINKDLSYKADELAEVGDRLLTLTPPSTFYGSKSAEIKSDKQYHDGCLIISDQLHVDPSEFTVLEYYNAIVFIEDKQKKQKSHGRLHTQRR